MSALEKSMHLGRLPSRPPLPGSGGSQSGAKMRMGYVTCTSLPGGQAQAVGEWCLCFGKERRELEEMLVLAWRCLDSVELGD